VPSMKLPDKRTPSTDPVGENRIETADVLIVTAMEPPAHRLPAQTLWFALPVNEPLVGVPVVLSWKLPLSRAPSRL